MCRGAATTVEPGLLRTRQHRPARRLRLAGAAAADKHRPCWATRSPAGRRAGECDFHAQRPWPRRQAERLRRERQPGQRWPAAVAGHGACRRHCREQRPAPPPHHPPARTHPWCPRGRLVHLRATPSAPVLPSPPPQSRSPSGPRKLWAGNAGPRRNRGCRRRACGRHAAPAGGDLRFPARAGAYGERHRACLRRRRGLAAQAAARPGLAAVRASDGAEEPAMRKNPSLVRCFLCFLSGKVCGCVSGGANLRLAHGAVLRAPEALVPRMPLVTRHLSLACHLS
jgi:hypothetical protein